MNQRNKNTNTQIAMDKLTVKEALAIDAAQHVMRNGILTDPYMPYISLTSLVMRKKIIKGIQKVANIVK